MSAITCAYYSPVQLKMYSLKRSSQMLVRTHSESQHKPATETKEQGSDAMLEPQFLWNDHTVSQHAFGSETSRSSDPNTNISSRPQC